MNTLIINARLVDGMGNPWFRGELLIGGDRIAAIGAPGQLSRTGAQIIDAQDLILTPGFIDIQSHSIVPLMKDGRCIGKVTQGVTTEIMGELWTPAPFGGLIESPFRENLFPPPNEAWVHLAKTWTRFGHWLAHMEQTGVSVNIGSLIPGGTLREYACGFKTGPANAAELEIQRRVLAECMEDGAFGIDYALIYPPDDFVPTDEIIELCKVCARYGGIYVTHMRSEGDRIEQALEETFRIAREAKIAAEIYHLKATGPRNWHKMAWVIAEVDKARRAGLDITANMYPYPASGTGLDAMLPMWVHANGKYFANLADPALRKRIRAGVLADDNDQAGITPDCVMPIGFRKDNLKPYNGKMLDEIARERGQDWVDCMLDLLLEQHANVATMYFGMHEDNLSMQIRQPWVKVSSDAGGHDPATAETPTHPRSYGTFTRVLRKFVREQGDITLESAIQKMTGAVAARLGLHERGRLLPGLFADLTLFNPDTVADRATFTDTHQTSTGIHGVWVNGVRILEDGIHTGARPGRFVKGSGATQP